MYFLCLGFNKDGLDVEAAAGPVVDDSDIAAKLRWIGQEEWA